jgi:methylated-DNA-protein-cysteine methyltransferase-like protein
VTTYGDVSAYFYDGNRNNGQAVGMMLTVCARNIPDITHRVVLEDGGLAPDRPGGGPSTQRLQLQQEGVPFLPNGKVDLAQCKVTL